MKNSIKCLVCILVTAFFIGFAFFIMSHLFRGCFITRDKSDKEAGYRKDIYDAYGISIPEEWAMLYFNPGTVGGFQGDGTAYYVYDVPQRDSKFFHSFSQTANAEFESDIAKIVNERFGEDDHGGPIDEQYMADLTTDYEWYQYSNLNWIWMIYQQDRLYIFAAYI